MTMFVNTPLGPLDVSKGGPMKWNGVSQDLPPEMPTPRPRSSYIGSHDIAVIVAAKNAREGRDTFATYKTEGELWQQKRGKLPESDPNDAPLWWGRMLEPVIFQRWLIENPTETRAGWRFGEGEVGTVFHPEFPFLGGTPDGIRIDGSEGADCKATDDWRSRFEWGVEGTDEIPLKLLVQGQWFMTLTGAKRWLFVVKGAASNWTLKTYVVEANPALGARLIAIGCEWWERHMVKGEMPEDCEARVLAAEWPCNNGKLLPPSAETDNLAIRVRKASIRYKRAETAFDKVKDKIRQHIADADGIEGLATWKANKKGVRSLRPWGGEWA